MTQLNDTLEQLIDTHGLDRVLTALEKVCGEKAEHLRTNWQDHAAAKEWERQGRLIGKALLLIQR